MYIGHFAAGLAIKSKYKKVPLWILLIGTGFLDILFSFFVLFRIEKISSKGFDFIDWSHSLFMSLFWSIFFALFFYRKGKAFMLAISMAVFSHYLLDVVSHAPDLAVYPYASMHFGLGLHLSKWNWWVELDISLFFFTFYLQVFKLNKNINLYSVSIVVLLLSLHFIRKALGL